jgi:CHAT domain-containing protein
MQEQGSASGLPQTALLLGDPPFREQHLVADAEAAGDEGDLTDVAFLRSAISGDVVALSELPRLSWSRSEVEAVEPLFRKATVLVGAEATERRLSEFAADGALAHFDVLHFATHALIDATQPQRSALVLSQLDEAEISVSGGHSSTNGLVTAAEIIRAWPLEADLVTLSACRTALGQNTAEGTLGLATAFLEAGSRCLLVSLWNVDDEATSLLMQRFYEAWMEEGLSKSEALRRSRGWLRSQRSKSGSRYDHPYYWSAFVLIGDAR